jgi:hypothetical protein
LDYVLAKFNAKGVPFPCADGAESRTALRDAKPCSSTSARIELSLKHLAD